MQIHGEVEFTKHLEAVPGQHEQMRGHQELVVTRKTHIINYIIIHLLFVGV